MVLVEDDADVNPNIPPSQLEYVRCLGDSHTQYTRFFDALLVPRLSHAAFFRDLKGFRSLSTTVRMLGLCNPHDTSTTKEQRQQCYKDVTQLFLASRYAHPWCRKAMAGMGNTKVGGWWGAEWSSTGRKMSVQQREQEDKLHKLLVPLWVCFRGRMFPGEDVIEQWWTRRQLELEQKRIADIVVSNVTSESRATSEAALTTPHKELGMASSHNDLKGQPPRDENDEDDSEDDGQNNATDRQTASVATGILRLAAAGMIINSMPKMQKWKLKREMKRR